MNNETNTVAKIKKIIIDETRAGQRIDNFLMAQFRKLPRTLIYRKLRKGEVRVNSKRIKPEYRLEIGDEVRIPPLRTPKQQLHTPSNSLSQLIEDSILYEDDDLLVLNKPANVAVHGGTTVSAGVIDALRASRPRQKFLELAHRLDKATSGCLIVAKKRQSLLELQELFKQGGIKKRYLALTKGHWLKKELTVAAPLLKSQLRTGERIVRVADAGKVSKTIFSVVQTFTDATLVEANLLTGRTHQIRVHAQYRGHPLAGDDKYGDEAFNKMMQQYGLQRLFLHARKIQFRLSRTGKTITVEAPLAKALERCLKKLEKSL